MQLHADRNVMHREYTKTVQIGDRIIGGGNPILIQSMTNTRTEDIKDTIAQIHRLCGFITVHTDYDD